jgi:transcriptional regulator with XRE-family HTH domain
MRLIGHLSILRGLWYPIGYHQDVDAAGVIRLARGRAGLSLRQLGRLAGTSHSTLSAYEAGVKVPTVATLDRIVRAAGFALDFDLSPVPSTIDDRGVGRVLELADRFSAHERRPLCTEPAVPLRL